MPAGEICKKSIVLCKNNFTLFFKYILLNLLVPIALLIPSLLMVVGLVLGFNDISDQQATFRTVLFLSVSVMLVVTSLYFSSWFAFAFNMVVYEKIQNKPVGSMGETLKKVRPLVWRCIGVSVLAYCIAGLPLFLAFVGFPVLQVITMKFGALFVSLGVFIMIALSLLGLYGIFHLIWFGIRLYFSVFGVLFESKKVMDSLRFSKTLVKNRWWAVFGRLLCLTLILLVSLMVFGAVFSFLEQINAVFGRMVEWFLGSILGVVFTIMTTYLFVSLKNTMNTEITSAPNPPQQNK